MIRRQQLHVTTQVAIHTALILCLACGVSAQKVCKFNYTGDPGKLVSAHFMLPGDAVAMGEKFYAFGSKNNQQVGGKSALFFIIDHSGSMMTDKNATDINGSRFAATKELIDIINQKNPKCEIGLCVFTGLPYFYANDDPIFERSEDGATGFIPLLRLDSTYVTTDPVGNEKKRTGYEILTFFLRTKVVKDPFNNRDYVDLEYKPTWIGLPGGTNITSGFRCSKTAFQKTEIEREHQFILFFSDGEANEPKGDSTTIFDYRNGKDVATSFTVYFTNDGSPALQNLVTMTNNIKKNGYSRTNPLSNLWSIKTDKATLMALLQKNVLPVIFSQLTSVVPKDVAVNSIKPSIGWKNDMFTFASLFPLVAKETPFQFSYTLSIVKDSISENGKDTIKIFTRDSTITGSFIADIDPTSPNSNNIKLTYWGRKLELYADNRLLSSVDGSMKTLEIRFTEFKVDTLYGYKDMIVEVTTQAGGVRDHERFPLRKKGNYHSLEITREIAPAQQDDGILQHQNPDVFDLVFRNKELVLDTIHLTIPFSGQMIHQIHSAIYFDRNADGHIDNIFLGVTGPKLAEVADRIMEKVQLPAFRDFAVESHRLVDGGINAQVQERASAIVTAVTDKDVVTIGDSIQISPILVVAPSKVVVTDSVAAVVMKASLHDHYVVIMQAGKVTKVERKKSELSVALSEKVEPVTTSNPFVYVRPSSGRQFEAVLGPLKQDAQMPQFTVSSVDDGLWIEEGDSLWINWKIGRNVVDLPGNSQENEKNIRRQITVTTSADTIELQAPFSLRFRASILRRGEKTTLASDIVSIKEIDAVVSKLETKGSNLFPDIMVITAEPDPKESVTAKDRFEGRFTIYDALGNIIVGKKAMGYDAGRRRLIYVWDGCSDLSRRVGVGAYKVAFDATYYFNDKKTRDERTFHLIGIKN
ncbi:MAG: hypothetical protein JW795_05610 [Chitinivibrionales bacterium]|nr:hypothetical protein [Chitinivibrionales bacterium]